MFWTNPVHRDTMPHAMATPDMKRRGFSRLSCRLGLEKMFLYGSSLERKLTRMFEGISKVTYVAKRTDTQIWY